MHSAQFLLECLGVKFPEIWQAVAVWNICENRIDYTIDLPLWAQYKLKFEQDVLTPGHVL